MDKNKDKAKRKERERQRQNRKRRLIVRNLSFKATEEDLKKIFSKYGNVVDVTIPVMENKKKRGFAFVQFERFNSLIKAMKELNYKEIHGRAIAIDYAVDKTKYQEKFRASKLKDEPTDDDKTPIKAEIKEEEESEASDDKNSESEAEEELSDSEKKVQNFLKEFDAGAEAIDNAELSDSDSDEEDSKEVDDDDDDDDDSDDQESGREKKHPKYEDKSNIHKRESNDISEGKTVFMRNVSFITTEEGLQEAMEEYGEFDYCLICMDKVTDHPKGTAFIKFKKKEDADKLIEKASDEPGIFLDGRRLQCSHAISRDTLQKQNEAKAKQPKDKRNLHLLKVGIIMPDSKEAEGVSQTDMKKRAQLEISMKQKLWNLNFFVSDKRLVVHNIPPNYTDKQLRNVFRNAANPRAIVTEARIMKDFKKVNSEGTAASRGFGFVCFNRHEDALSALTKLNNNPDVFTPQKRPIVEFSVENKMALMSKERRKEKSHMLNKRKAEMKSEQVKEEQLETQTSQSSGNKLTNKNKRRKRKQRNETNSIVNKKVKFNEPAKQEAKQAFQNDSMKQKKVKNKKGKKQNEPSLPDLINKYKVKLLNKMA